MTDSDSDLEVLDEIPIPLPRSRRSSARRRRSPSPVFDDDDGLLDLDEHYLLVSNGSSSSSAKKNKSKDKRPAKSATGKIPVTSNTKKSKNSPPHIVLSDDEDNNGSDATEVIRDDDDLDSLPSISPPSSPPPSQKKKAAAMTYDNKSNENEVMEVEYNSEREFGFRDTYPTQSSCATSSTALSQSSSKSSLRDNRGDVDFDDLLQDVECESLADYLAKIDKKKSEKTPNKGSSSGATSGSFSSVSATSSKAVPSFSSFARQKLEAVQSNPKSLKSTSSKINFPSEDIEKPVKSYQVNRKSQTRATKTKKKVKENVAASSSSSSSSLPPVPPPVQGVQGPNRLKQPKDVLKVVKIMIVLQIAENILSDELAAKLIEREARFEIVNSPAIANSILFEHNVPYKMTDKDLQVHEKMHKEIDANMLIIFPVEQHLELLQGELDRVESSPSGSERLECLTEWIQSIQRRHPEKKITLLIYGLETYLRKIQRVVQKEYRDRVLQGDNPDNPKKKRKAKSSQGIKLSRYEVQNALISAQLETHMNYRFYENNSDLTLLLLQYAKSVGEAPYKHEKLKSNDFDWYAVADAVGGIPAEESGQGMRSLWLAQLQQFPKVGQESALAIARIYGSPLELYQAYRRCSSVEEGKNLLTNVQVTMGVGPLAKTRRLGPEASKKIYRFFTSTDGEREIDG